MKKKGYNSNPPVRLTGLLLINADDWGRDRETTDRTLDCVRKGCISSVSAMVFMDDSDRAAATAQEYAIDSGLHLNLTTPFTGGNCSARLRECQEKTARFLLRNRLAQALFHPGLTSAFEYVVKSQLDEFSRLYGTAPSRLDGHHHMHLCANVLYQGLLPQDTIVRRNFSFEAGEKSVWNRLYRHWVDGRLAKRHRLTDSFFSLVPLEPRSRVEAIFLRSRNNVVEVEAHPVNKDEYQFLMEGGIRRLGGNVKVGFAV